MPIPRIRLQEADDNSTTLLVQWRGNLKNWPSHWLYSPNATRIRRRCKITQPRRKSDLRTRQNLWISRPSHRSWTYITRASIHYLRLFSQRRRGLQIVNIIPEWSRLMTAPTKGYSLQPPSQGPHSTPRNPERSTKALRARPFIRVAPGSCATCNPFVLTL